MSLTSVRRVDELEGLFVLAPERYDPRREGLFPSSPSGVPLRNLVRPSRRIFTASDGPDRQCLVLDTSDAQEGIVVLRKRTMPVRDIGSAKKVIDTGDLIISRLRPYLRQVAFVDAKVGHRADHVLLLCSTEFFVLQPMDEHPIAFLVPFLLCGPVQKVLAASQEGGHHPRFNESALLELPVPLRLLEERDRVSKAVEDSIALFRASDSGMVDLIERAELSLRDASSPAAGTAPE